MTEDERPYVLHRPSGDVAVVEAHPEFVTIHNTGERHASYALVVGGPAFGSSLRSINAALGLVGELVRRTRGKT